MKKYLRLPIKIILHNKLYWALVLVMAFSVAFLGIIENVSINMSEEVYEEQKSIFGSFQYAAYMDGTNLKDNEFGTAYVNELFADKNIQTVGYIYKLGLAEIEGFTVDFGYLDEEAWHLSEAKLIEGEMPQKTGEVALSDTKISELAAAAAYEVGSEIEINGKAFTISGIYEEFGAGWVGSNSFRFFSEVDGIFSKEETERIWNGNRSRLLTVLMDERDLFSQEEMQDAKNIFSNIYITEEYAKNMYELPAFIIPTILCMSFLLIGSILLLIGKQRKAVNTIYLQLGIGERQLIIIQSIAFLICYSMGLAFGLFSIYGITSLLVTSQNVKFTLRDIYVNWNIIVITAAYLIAMTILYFWFEKKLNSSTRKSSSKKFLRGSFIVSRYFCIFMFVCSLVIMWEYVITSFHQEQYEKENLPSIAGEMDEIQKIGYDFELLSVNTTTPKDHLITNQMPDDSSGIYFYNNSMYFGMSEESIKEFDSLEGVSHTKQYKENNTIMLHINGDHVTDYIDGSDFIKDGRYLPRALQNWESTITEYYGLEEKLLVNSKILGCSDDDLTALGDYLAEGILNLDKMTRGEEVILVAPKFSLNKLNGKRTLMSRKLPGSQDDSTYFADESFSVGDMITFYALQPRDVEVSFGAISGRDVIDNFELVTCEAKIGAIVYDYTGWFLHDEIAKPYTLVVNHKAFADFGLKSENTRLRIYTKEDADEEDITKLIYKKYRDIDSPMKIENKMRSERIHKKYLDFLQTIKTVFTGLSAIAFFAIVVIHMILQILYHKRTIGLLLLNGLTLHQLFWNLLKALLKIWIVSMLVLIFSVYFIMMKESGDVIRVANIMLPGVIVLIVQIAALLPCYLFLKKNSMIQLLK